MFTANLLPLFFCRCRWYRVHDFLHTYLTSFVLLSPFNRCSPRLRLLLRQDFCRMVCNTLSVTTRQCTSMERYQLMFDRDVNTTLETLVCGRRRTEMLSICGPVVPRTCLLPSLFLYLFPPVSASPMLSTPSRGDGFVRLFFFSKCLRRLSQLQDLLLLCFFLFLPYFSLCLHRFFRHL